MGAAAALLVLPVRSKPPAEAVGMPRKSRTPGWWVTLYRPAVEAVSIQGTARRGLVVLPSIQGTAPAVGPWLSDREAAALLCCLMEEPPALVVRHYNRHYIGLFVFFWLIILLSLSGQWVCKATSPKAAKGGGLTVLHLFNTANSNNNETMTQELQELADLITRNVTNSSKEVLTSEEAAQYMGISKSTLYKLTMTRAIPHYKPTGNRCYFNRVELENWLQSYRVAPATEIADRAAAYCMKKGGQA